MICLVFTSVCGELRIFSIADLLCQNSHW